MSGSTSAQASLTHTSSRCSAGCQRAFCSSRKPQGRLAFPFILATMGTCRVALMLLAALLPASEAEGLVQTTLNKGPVDQNNSVTTWLSGKEVGWSLRCSAKSIKDEGHIVTLNNYMEVLAPPHDSSQSHSTQQHRHHQATAGCCLPELVTPRNAGTGSRASSFLAEVRDVAAACGKQEDEWAPLANVVLDCTRWWFQDMLKEGCAGDAA